MLQPYEPGKIPVVFIHGLWSSPIIWMPVINDLQGDQTLRNHFQFWYFMYPTGNPFAYSAAMLRTSLNEAVRSLDPEGKDPALQRMVLVGHSMGGLLAKMMVQDSQSELWNLVSKQPIDQIQADEEERERIRQVFMFEPQPFVDRVVFIATPHRGSNVSKRFIGRLGSAMISLPRTLLESQDRLLDKNPDAFTQFFQKPLPTSVDNLSPDSPIIQAVANLEIDPKVRYHSIIGNTREGTIEAGNDGVVPYTSSHMEGAESEYIVPAGHSSCQSHPLTVLEIQRILYDHITSSPDDVKVQHADLELSKQ
jgi:pimeloyl-ACP methyl ester carboxylesterase